MLTNLLILVMVDCDSVLKVANEHDKISFEIQTM